MDEPETAHPIERLDPPFVASERAMLESWLDFHRATLLTKCERLTDDQLKSRSVPPSPLSLLGLVRHLTDVERNWFRRVLADEDASPLYYSDANRDGEFDDVLSADVTADMGRYHDELDRCRRVAAGYPDLDAVGTGRRGGRRISVSLRWIYVHMIEEYARHNGHADLIRERVDGTTGV
jgi:uncharacterized damage-inducible protein DinB